MTDFQTAVLADVELIGECIQVALVIVVALVAVIAGRSLWS